MADLDFQSCGGRAEALMNAGANPMDPNNLSWNFGLVTANEPANAAVAEMIQDKPTLYTRFPNMAGRWNGKTVNHWAAVRAVLGDDKADTLIQHQPRGTCGGRAGSLAIDMLQCVLIALGKRAKFKRASHAFLYWQARKKYGMDRGQPWDDRNDGVASGSIPEIMASVGIDTRDETGDTNAYGAGSDDLAAQWGAGKIDPALAAKLVEFARDNVVTEWSPVYSAQELADGIAAGGIGIGSDSQGFSGTRDARGFCRPVGVWHHYHVRGSVLGEAEYGQNGFGYCQSWGKNNPGGPQLAGHPSNCFGVDWATQDRTCRSGRWAVVFGLPLFDLEQTPIDIPWSF
jgi:hypothetical protein